MLLLFADQEMDGVLKPCIDGHSDSNPRFVVLKLYIVYIACHV